jgi:hypothetical protein
VAKEKVTKEKGHPAWRLPPIPGRQVREPGPGFSNGLPARAKRSRPPVDSRYAACRPRLTAAQGPRVEQRAILARTWCASRQRQLGWAVRPLLHLPGSAGGDGCDRRKSPCGRVKGALVRRSSSVLDRWKNKLRRSRKFLDAAGSPARAVKKKARDPEPHARVVEPGARRPEQISRDAEWESCRGRGKSSTGRAIFPTGRAASSAVAVSCPASRVSAVARTQKRPGA